MIRQPLTKNRKAFYDALVLYVQTYNHAATSVAMAKIMGYSSNTSSIKMLNALEDGGWIYPRKRNKKCKAIGAWPVDVPLQKMHKSKVSVS